VQWETGGNRAFAAPSRVNLVGAKTDLHGCPLPEINLKGKTEDEVEFEFDLGEREGSGSKKARVRLRPNANAERGTFYFSGRIGNAGIPERLLLSRSSA
jgi:hypothetical protein